MISIQDEINSHRDLQVEEISDFEGKCRMSVEQKMKIKRLISNYFVRLNTKSVNIPFQRGVPKPSL